MAPETEQGTAPKSKASLDDIVEQSTIRFPKPLTIEQTKKLFKYIARNLPANINYETSQHFSIHRAHSRLVDTPGTPSVSGMINSYKNLGAFDTFTSVYSLTSEHSPYLPRISALHFDTTLGYSLLEHDTQKVRLWQDVKKLAEEYFKLKYKK